MSYEGYHQYLCAYGHYHEQDCYQDDLKVCNRAECEQPIVWWNSVDITNGSFEGRKRIDGYVKLKILHEIKCQHCNSILETIYAIPRKAGHKISPNKKLGG